MSKEEVVAGIVIALSFIPIVILVMRLFRLYKNSFTNARTISAAITLVILGVTVYYTLLSLFCSWLPDWEIFIVILFLLAFIAWLASCLFFLAAGTMVILQIFYWAKKHFCTAKSTS